MRGAAPDGRLFQGEFYELSIRLGGAVGDDVAAAVWERGDVEGPYAHPFSPKGCAGWAMVVAEREVALAVHVRADTADVSLPIASIDEAFGTDVAGDPWSSPPAAVGDWLANVARTIFGRAPFEFALIERELGEGSYIASHPDRFYALEEGAIHALVARDGALQEMPRRR